MLCFMAASKRARCSGGNLASDSAGIAGMPLMECVTVICQRPSLTLSGVIVSAAQTASPEHASKERATLNRIGILQFGPTNCAEQDCTAAVAKQMDSGAGVGTGNLRPS